MSRTADTNMLTLDEPAAELVFDGVYVWPETEAPPSLDFSSTSNSQFVPLI